MTAASLVYPSWLLAAVLTAAAFRLVRLAATGRLSVRTPIDLPVGLILLMIPVTLWATALPELTRVQALRLLSGIGLYYAIANWGNTSQRLRLLLTGLLLAGAFLALTAPFSVVWPIGKLPFIPPGWYERFQNLLADSIHPNVLAGSLVLILPIALAWLLAGWSRMDWFERVFSGAVTLLLLGMLMLTQSRGAWMAAAIAIGLVLLLCFRRSWIWLAGLGAAGVAALVWLGLPQSFDSILTANSTGGLALREEIWSRAVMIIEDFPLTGIGMGSFPNVADAMYPFSPVASGTIHHAHNLFLQIAVDLGLFGLIAWLAIFVIITLMAVQLLQKGRKNQEIRLRALGIGVVGSQSALFVHGLTDAVTWGMVRPAPLVWAVWGLAAAGWLIMRQKPES